MIRSTVILASIGASAMALGCAFRRLKPTYRPTTSTSLHSSVSGGEITAARRREGMETFRSYSVPVKCRHPGELKWSLANLRQWSFLPTGRW